MHWWNTNWISEKFLTFDPEKRITVEEALKHPFLESMHDPDDEPVCPKKFDFVFDKNIKLKDDKDAIKSSWKTVFKMFNIL